MKILNSIIRYFPMDEYIKQHPDWQLRQQYRDENGVQNNLSLLPANQVPIIEQITNGTMVKYIYVDVPDVSYSELTEKDIALTKTNPPVIILTPYTGAENLAVNTPLNNLPVINPQENLNLIDAPVIPPVIDEPILPPIDDAPVYNPAPPPPEIYVVPNNEEKITMLPIEERPIDITGGGDINSDPGWIDLGPMDNFPTDIIYADPGQPIDNPPITTIPITTDTPVTNAPATVENQIIPGIENKNLLIGGAILLLLFWSK